jgi:hypothetical protein
MGRFLSQHGLPSRKQESNIHTRLLTFNMPPLNVLNIYDSGDGSVTPQSPPRPSKSESSLKSCKTTSASSTKRQKTRTEKSSTETSEEKAKRRKEKKEKKGKKEKNEKKERKEKTEKKDKESQETGESLSLGQQKLLLYVLNTLGHELEQADEKIRHLEDRNDQMSDLSAKLIKAEQQLEYATKENEDCVSCISALKQALHLQKAELDNARAAIRQSVRQELDQLKQERDRAVDRATKEVPIDIQLAELQAEQPRGRESCAVIEQWRAPPSSMEDSKSSLVTNDTAEESASSDDELSGSSEESRGRGSKARPARSKLGSVVVSTVRRTPPSRSSSSLLLTTTRMIRQTTRACRLGKNRRVHTKEQ